MADPFRRLLRKHPSSTMAFNASRTWLAVPISERTGWAEGGPLWMLEHGVGGPEAERLEFRGRVMFPERLHVVATVIDITTSLLSTVDQFGSGLILECFGEGHPGRL